MSAFRRGSTTKCLGSLRQTSDCFPRVIGQPGSSWRIATVTALRKTRRGMRINKVTIKNFRNLADLEIPLQPGTVIVGENRVGKSNFIHALRLVLDPTLPNSERYLRREDFWDGLSDGTTGWDPMVAGEEIEVSVDFSNFEDEAAALTALSDALIEGDPMVAR